jgi:hypothetical protein
MTNYLFPIVSDGGLLRDDEEDGRSRSGSSSSSSEESDGEAGDAEKGQFADGGNQGPML